MMQDQRLLSMFANARRVFSQQLSGYFGQSKHNYEVDFGWPNTLTFNEYFHKYQRNGMAKAAVNKTVIKTWEDNPWFSEDDQKEQSEVEKAVANKMDDLGLWQKLAEADRRSMVGGYAGLILRIADGKKFDKPVTKVNGLNFLVEVIVTWAPQLTVASWDNDQQSETYGQPTMYMFNESAVDENTNNANKQKNRSFLVHPDRVVIWSKDGTVHAPSDLEAGYNDLIDMEKIKGAGGEGFWKNAKAAPVLEIDKDASLREMAAAMGVEEDGILDAMNDQVESYNKGFDNILMLQGMTSKPHNIQMAVPESFFMVALRSFAASVAIPLKVLVGSQSGERASTEDAREWSQTINARRKMETIPSIRRVMKRMTKIGVLSGEWKIGWTDLTRATMSDKLELAAKMANINNKTDVTKSGKKIFTDKEIRVAVDYPAMPILVDEETTETGPEPATPELSGDVE